MSEVATPAPDATQGPQVRSRLITSPTDRSEGKFTANVTTSARLATQRGLAQYLSQLEANAPGGRRVRLMKVFEEWSEPETHAVYPAAVVRGAGPVTFSPRQMGAPYPDEKCRLPAPDGRYLMAFNDALQDLQVEVWCTDPMERSSMELMLEAALNPVMFRSGFVLELPHYFNARATYQLKDVTIPDDDGDAVRRYRRLQYTVSTSVPQMQLFSFPDARPQFVLTATDVDLDLVVTTEVT